MPVRVRLAALLLASAASGAWASTKIVGGVPAKPGEFPYIAIVTDGKFLCGGSVIAPHWVLTAGHCVAGRTASQLRVVVGDYRVSALKASEIYLARRAILHPRYNNVSDRPDYDVALVQLARATRARPIRLNTAPLKIPEDPSRAPLAWVAGWGVTAETAKASSDVLRKVRVPLVARDVCDQEYRGLITDRMLCAAPPSGGKDACFGDSGGPLVFRRARQPDLLVGVVSWGNGCARPGFPGIYSDVGFFGPWIARTLHAYQ